MYHIYSDYSKTEKEASYAYVVILFEKNKQPVLLKSGSRRLKMRHSCCIGEAMGSLAGLRCVPDGEQAIIHTDVDGLHVLLKSTRRRHRSLRKQQLEFIKHSYRLQQIHFIFLQRKQRPLIYHWCHNKARSRIVCKNNLEPVNLKNLQEKALQEYFIKPKQRKKKKKQQQTKQSSMI